jgi:hypothetical protein
MAGSLAAMRKRPAPASGRRISRTPARAEFFLWKPGERVDGPPRVTREHFVSEALDDHKG